MTGISFINTGWYLLPHSDTPYYGTIPEGAKTLTDAEAKKLVPGDQVGDAKS